MAPQNTAVPPSLPPSVEEAYRRKCVQLKNRTIEVEDSNDAARLRLTRVKRQVEKLRIERAFLLEQLAKRTSANVEDSDGSPSPPPTPKEKPLRTKRGHRKGEDGKGDGPGSPTQTSGRKKATNGVSKPAETAFDIFAAEQKTKLEGKELEGSIDDEISRLWRELSDKDKEPYEEKAAAAAAAAAEADKSKEDDKADDATAEAEADADKKEGSKSEEPVKKETQDEDVEMTNYDTEEQETQDKDGDE